MKAISICFMIAICSGYIAKPLLVHPQSGAVVIATLEEESNDFLQEMKDTFKAT